MKERKTSQETPPKNRSLSVAARDGGDQRVIGSLERMMEECKMLCREDDPVLQGQMQLVLGVLADVLEVKDPHNHFEHVVEYE